MDSISYQKYAHKLIFFIIQHRKCVKINVLIIILVILLIKYVINVIIHVLDAIIIIIQQLV